MNVLDGESAVVTDWVWDAAVRIRGFFEETADEFVLPSGCTNRLLVVGRESECTAVLIEIERQTRASGKHTHVWGACPSLGFSAQNELWNGHSSSGTEYVKVKACSGQVLFNARTWKSRWKVIFTSEADLDWSNVFFEDKPFAAVFGCFPPTLPRPSLPPSDRLASLRFLDHFKHAFATRVDGLKDIPVYIYSCRLPQVQRLTRAGEPPKSPAPRTLLDDAFASLPSSPRLEKWLPQDLFAIDLATKRRSLIP